MKAKDGTQSTGKATGREGGRSLKTRVKTARKRSLSSTLWLERQLNDPYVARAKHEGYRSRAAFKLLEVDDKYHLLRPGQRIVDLGAAPGGWSQVAAKRIGATSGSGRVIGIDLLEIDPIAGVDFAVMDFNAPDAPERLKQMLGGRADGVISDMAANATGTSEDRSPPHRRPGRTGSGFCARGFVAGWFLPRQSAAGRHRRRPACQPKTRFHQSAARETGREPLGFGGTLCARDRVSRHAGLTFTSPRTSRSGR